MAAVEIRGLDELIRGISELERNQLPFAIAKSLTDIAVIAMGNTVNEMKSVFDRPTPFTLNSLKVERAKKTQLQSRVMLKDPTRIDDPDHYLNPQTIGGKRGFKAFEARLFRKRILPAGYYTVPGNGADIDGYGNMSRGQIVQILSYFDAFGDAGFRADMGDEGRTRLASGTGRRYGIAYFSIQPGARSHLHPGIYKRINSNFGSAIKLVLLFVRNVTYSKKLNIQRIADETYDRNFNEIFRQNFINAVNTAIPRQ